MAQGDYIINIAAQVDEAISNLQNVSKELKGMEGTVKTTGTATKGLSLEMLAFAGTMTATATSVISMGASLQDVTFRSERALGRLGIAADDLAAKFHNAGMAATELLPVAAQLANFGIVADEVEGASTVIEQFGLTVGMSTQQAVESIGKVGAVLGAKTAADMAKISGGLGNLELASKGSTRANVALLESLGPQIRAYGLNASAVTGARTAMESFGVAAGDASTFLTKAVQSFEFGTASAIGFAQAIGMPASKLDEFRAADPADQLKMMVKFMGDTGESAGALANRLSTILGVSKSSALAMVNMAREGDRLNHFLGIAAEGFGDTTAHEKNFEEASKNLSVQLRMLWKQLRALGTSAGAYLAPIVTGLVSILGAVLTVVQAIPGPVRAVAVAIIGLAGAKMLLSKVISTQLVTGFATSIKQVVLFGWEVLKTTGYVIAYIAKVVALRVAQNALALAEGLGIVILGVLKGLYIATTAVVKGLVMALKSETLATVLLTAKKWLLTAAIVAKNIAVGIAKGLWIATTGLLYGVGIATVVASSGFWALAASVWAALAPLLPFIAIGALIVAAVVGIGYAIYQVGKIIVDNWTAIWEGVVSVMSAVWSGLQAVGSAFVAIGQFVGGVVVAAFRQYWNILQAVWGTIWSVATAIWDGLVNALRTLWGWIVTAGETIAAPFVALWDVIVSIGDAIGGVVGWLFGSSLFHLKEGVAEVMPSLGRMKGAFEGIGQAANRIGLESHIPDDIRVRVAEPLAQSAGGAFGPAEQYQGKQAFGGPAGSGPTAGIDRPEPTKGAAGAGEGVAGGGGGRIVIPVTIKLDNEVLGRAVTEYQMDAGRERYGNASLEPLRGTGR